jgi:hypothetical protein
LLGEKKIHTENTQFFQVHLPNKISKNKKILPPTKITASDLWHLYVSDKDREFVEVPSRFWAVGSPALQDSGKYSSRANLTPAKSFLEIWYP